MSIVKTTVTLKCGHTEEFETLGEMRQATMISSRIIYSALTAVLKSLKKLTRRRNEELGRMQASVGLLTTVLDMCMG